jgi:hypothetical protein
MAKIKLVAPYEEFRGRDSARNTPNGSVVFPRAGGVVSRSFIRPQQPNSPIQHFARFALAGATTTWNLLSGSDKTSWDDLGQTITRTSKTGFTYHPTGRALWIEASVIGSRNSGGPPSTAPTSVEFPPLLAPTVLTVEDVDSPLIVDLPAVALETFILFSIAGPFSTGVRSLKGRNFFNPTLSPADPGFLQGATFDLSPAATNFAFVNNSLRFIPQAGLRYGVRMQVLDSVAKITGPVYESILTATT